ncbi:immunity 21 family protein [Streptomyces sp. NBC_00287]
MVPCAALSHWSGTEGDYDRACEVMEFVGVLALPDGAEALVLGNEPLSTPPIFLSIGSSSAGATRRARMVSPTSSGLGFSPPSS